jgi:tripartite-type tricarboxylate transporter receptor subunit TctC
LGSPHQFYGVLIGQQLNLPLQNIPYQGSAPILAALLGGQVASAIDVASSQVENHRAGKIRMLAVSSPARIPQAPEVPTFTELGFPGISGMGFNALYAPGGTPAAVVSQWNRAVAKVLAQPEVKDRLFAMGFMPVGQGTDELIERQNQSARKWEPVIKASGFLAD